MNNYSVFGSLHVLTIPCPLRPSPDGAHCPDCNVCVAGYDHHCVWMGQCIGKRNYKQFIRFNIMWLYYAVFAVLWVLSLGPFFMGDGKKDSHNGH